MIKEVFKLFKQNINPPGPRIERSSIRKLPADYLKPAAKQGSLSFLRYDGGRRVATVYTPYGYQGRPSDTADEAGGIQNKHYDIMYIVHGRGGSNRTWLGTPDEPRRLKFLLDNMISHGDIRPLIVVAPSLDFSFGSDDDVIAESAEIFVRELIPAVEATYNSFAVSTDEDGLAASRDHRICAGFSMGGCLSWYMLANHVSLFRYFLPMSMAMYFDSEGYSAVRSTEAAARIERGIAASGYTADSYEVFAATGSLDYKNHATRMQVLDLLDDVHFRLSVRESDGGNISFHEWPHRKHSFKQSLPYIYNGLLRFLGK